MKHTLGKFFAILLAICLCLSFAGCGGNGDNPDPESGSGPTPGHTHTFATTWSSDESGHWHAATCEHGSEKADISAHTYENGKCKTCQYEHVAHVFAAYEKTAEKHSRTCQICGKTESATHTYEEGKCTECEYEHGDHTFGAYVKTETEHSHTCSDCGKTVSSAHTYENGKCKICEYRHQDHSYGADNICEVCGAKKVPYTMSGDGTKIHFGEYPQSEVKESDLKASLNMEAGGVPTAEDNGKWTSYQYYSYNSVSDYMWYIDVNYQNNRYRGVYFTYYRPKYTSNRKDAAIGWQDDNGYHKNTVYWFKYDPIEWRILDQQDGNVLLMSNIILDSQPFYHSRSSRNDSEKIYANNYKESDVRTWLNETFLDISFASTAQAIIQTTDIRNDLASTEDESNAYICADTADKVFLLSRQEVSNAAFGFHNDENRILKSTDYAKSQGAWQGTADGNRGNGWWWLRSPRDDKNGYNAHGVSADGSIGADRYDYVNRTSGGIVPALWIKL